MTMKYYCLASLLFLPAASVIAQQPPTFYLQPQSQSPSIVDNVSLRAGASGTLPVAYQWVHNNETLTGATNLTLMLTNIQLVQSGEYQIQASNAWGTALSTVALLDIDSSFTQI